MSASKYSHCAKCVIIFPRRNIARSIICFCSSGISIADKVYRNRRAGASGPFEKLSNRSPHERSDMGSASIRPRTRSGTAIPHVAALMWATPLFKKNQRLRFFILTPAPPPFSAMNSMPAFSRAR